MAASAVWEERILQGSGVSGLQGVGFRDGVIKKILVLGHVHPLAHKDVLRRSATVFASDDPC